MPKMSFLALLLSLVSLAAPLPVHAQAGPPTEELTSLLTAQEQAWNRGDGTIWAAPFTDDADFINIRGDIFHGRAQIADRHNAILSGPYRGSVVHITIRQLTPISDTCVLVESLQRVTHFAKLPPGIQPTAPDTLDTLMKYVAVQRDGHWQFVAAQNTAILPSAPLPPHSPPPPR